LADVSFFLAGKHYSKTISVDKPAILHVASSHFSVFRHLIDGVEALNPSSQATVAAAPYVVKDDVNVIVPFFS
jgi:hypothetical protein